MKMALPLFKLLHLLGAMGFVGATAAQWVLARSAEVQQAAKAVANGVTGPALLLMIASGMLLVALRPALLEQRWMWAKLLLTMVIAPAAWFGAGIGALALALGLSVAAAAIAVWRPRWGQTRER